MDGELEPSIEDEEREIMAELEDMQQRWHEQAKPLIDRLLRLRSLQDGDIRIHTGLIQ